MCIVHVCDGIGKYRNDETVRRRTILSISQVDTNRFTLQHTVADLPRGLAVLVPGRVWIEERRLIRSRSTGLCYLLGAFPLHRTRVVVPQKHTCLCILRIKACDNFKLSLLITIDRFGVDGALLFNFGLIEWRC